jgi:hypothetical protein
MTRAEFIRQAAEARNTMQALARMFPGCFHADGRAIVAEARLLPPLQTKARHEPPNVRAKAEPVAPLKPEI